MSIPRLLDVHTHVQFHAFKEDADLVVERALTAGVWMINVGTQADTSQAAIAMAEKYPEGVYATVGLHPIHTDKSFHDQKEFGGEGEAFTSRGEEFNFAEYKKLAEHPKVVGIGECGLDYYRLEEHTQEKQKAAFLEQIRLSLEVKKPLMIHCRRAFADLVEILQGEKGQLNEKPGIIHFFSGDLNDAKSLLDLGFSFSFGGVLTFTRDYDEVVKYIPPERIVLETDAPYITPVPYRGKRNEPLYVEEVAKKLAELKNQDFAEVTSLTFNNAAAIFGIRHPGPLI